MYISRKMRQAVVMSVISGGLMLVPTFTPVNTTDNLMPIASVAHAEVQTYTGIGEYLMSDFETPDVAKQRAKMYAERNAQEQAGVYVSSYSKTENFNLIEDEILTITNGILSVIDVKYDMVPINDAGGGYIKWRATITVTIDTSKVDEWLARGISERANLVAKNQELQRAIAEQERQIADLQAQLAAANAANNQQTKTQLQEEFSQADRIFLSNQKLEEGNRFFVTIFYDEALEAWNKSIELNPDNGLAYESRGYYYNLSSVGEYDKAISDFNNAIRLNPNNALNYYYRGSAYLSTSEYDLASADFEQAISMDPSISGAYDGLASISVTFNQYERAIEYATRAIEFEPRNQFAYTNRAAAYYYLGQYDLALSDLNISIDIDPSYGYTYRVFGLCYQALGDELVANDYFNLANDPPAAG